MEIIARMLMEINRMQLPRITLYSKTPETAYASYVYGYIDNLRVNSTYYLCDIYTFGQVYL